MVNMRVRELEVLSGQLLCSKTLCVLGKWMSTSGVAKSSVVLENYFADAITCLKNRKTPPSSRPDSPGRQDNRLSCRAHFRLAAYAGLHLSPSPSFSVT